MKKIFFGALALTMVSGAALAADSMASMYGNTMVSTHADGNQVKHFYKADHTFTAIDSKGTKSSGTWAVAGGKICMMQTSPAPAAGMEKRCGPEFPVGKKAGDSWDATADDGTKYKLSIVAGQ